MSKSPSSIVLHRGYTRLGVDDLLIASVSISLASISAALSGNPSSQNMFRNTTGVFSSLRQNLRMSGDHDRIKCFSIPIDEAEEAHLPRSLQATCLKH